MNSNSLEGVGDIAEDEESGEDNSELRKFCSSGVALEVTIRSRKAFQNVFFFSISPYENLGGFPSSICGVLL